jgi:GNAT superfamily N-acetyltransferase
VRDLACEGSEALQIRVDDLRGPEIAALLEQHLAHMRRVVRHILETAKQRGYRRLSLETGSTPDFAPAHSLYARFGFRPCGPFADYKQDPFSLYMTKEL